MVPPFNFYYFITAFSTISTTLHLLSLESGLVSITFTLSPTLQAFSSSCAFNLYVLFAFFLLLVTCNSVMGTIPAIPADVYNHQLYYTAPATIWEETLPLGNGRLGMMPDGGVDREHIVLNEISLWSGMEADYGNPDASRSLPAIQQLLFEGKNKEAQELMYSSFGC